MPLLSTPEIILAELTDLGCGRRQLEWAETLLHGDPVQLLNSAFMSQQSLRRRMEGCGIPLLTVHERLDQRPRGWRRHSHGHWYAPDLATRSTVEWAISHGCAGGRVEAGWREVVGPVGRLLGCDAVGLRLWLARALEAMGGA